MAAAFRLGSIASGIQWTGAAQATRVVLQFGVSIVLARLLEPGDFGLLAMASAVTAMAGMFQSLGMHGPIVQREHVTLTLIDTVFITNLVLSALMTIGLIAAAPWLAGLYRDPAVEPILRVMALTLFMYALSGVPGALLRRHMRFPAIAKAAVAAGVAQATIALTLAFNGYGVWSLVNAVLAAAVVEALLLLIAARYWPGLNFSWASLRSIAAFSMNITGVNVLDMIGRHADKIVIGRWLGADAVGFYGMAQRFTRQPISVFVRPVLGPVLFPAYSRMQNDDGDTASTMRRAIAGVSLLTFPALVGFALVAEPFVMGLLGAKWEPAIYVMYAFAPVGILKGWLVTVMSVLVARDRTGVFLALRVVYTLALVAAYAIGLRWGLFGIALCILVVEALVSALEIYFCARQVRAGMLWMLSGCTRIIGATLAMALCVVLVRWAGSELAWGHITELAMSGLVGAGVYVVMVLILRPPAVSDLAGLLPEPAKSAVRRRVASARRG